MRMKMGHGDTGVNIVGPSSKKILIPAAGFGTRVGSPPAKELLINPLTQRPLIEFAFSIAEELNVEAHVISRTEKTLLNHYLAHRGVSYQAIASSRDWPESLVLSCDFWSEYNVVLLPDTEFAPISVVKEIFDLLEFKQNSSVFATFHHVPFAALNTWGCVWKEGEMAFGWEKPNLSSFPDPSSTDRSITSIPSIKPWGVFGFSKNVGVELLTNMLDSSQGKHAYRLPHKTQFIDLDSFSDLTRQKYPSHPEEA